MKHYPDDCNYIDAHDNCSEVPLPGYWFNEWNGGFPDEEETFNDNDMCGQIFDEHSGWITDPYCDDDDDRDRWGDDRYDDFDGYPENELEDPLDE